MQIYWVVTLAWFLLLGSGYSSQGNVEKYIAKSYFDKHGSLIDSQFEDFIVNELPLGLCQILKHKPRVLDLNRRLIGEGSHRRLSSSIKFDVRSFPTPHQNSCSWEVISIERLPSGVFADPFELQHLVQQGVFHDAAVFGDTNLELPSFRSNRSLVEIHKKIDFDAITQDKDGFDIHVSLPLHVRYPRLGQGFSRIEFGLPDLFVKCRCEAGGSDESCLVSTNRNYESKTVDTVWEVPTGIKGHARVVSAVTFISAAVSALLIVFTSIYHSHSTVYDEVKQS